VLAQILFLLQLIYHTSRSFPFLVITSRSWKQSVIQSPVGGWFNGWLRLRQRSLTLCGPTVSVLKTRIAIWRRLSLR